MKTKSLFLALSLILVLPLIVNATSTVTDQFLIPAGLTTEYSENVNPSIYPCTSGAKYVGSVDYDPDNHLVYMYNLKVWATKVSPGLAKSVTIYWDGTGDYNTVDASTIHIFGQHTAYVGNETYESMTGTELGSRTYAGEESYTIDLSTYDYEYIAIVGGIEGIAFTRLDIAWTIEDVSTYAVTTSKTGSGTISVSPASPIAEGVTVTVTFTGTGARNEINSYTISGATTIEDTDLGEEGYKKSVSTTFIMPAHPVDISAVFASKPTRLANPISVDGEVSGEVKAIVTSGGESTFTISTNYNSTTSPAYTKSISVTTTNGKVEVVGNTYSSSTGSGVLTLRGLAAGSDVVTISTVQTNGCQVAQRQINVTVVGKDVALITNLNGKYYAVSNSIAGSMTSVAAYEVIKDGENYYYTPAVNISDMTWKFEIADADYYFIRNSEGKYLKRAGANISLASASFNWSINAEGRLVDDYMSGLCYNETLSAFSIEPQSQYLSTSAISAPVYQVPIANIQPALLYSTNSMIANIYDSRSLTTGKMGTICVPFDVPMSFISGATFYTIESKLVSAGNLTGLNLAEVTDKLEAGHSYIFEATGSSIDIYYGSASATNASVIANDGFVGMLLGDGASMPVPDGVTPRTDGCYGIASNKLRYVAEGGTATIKPYRAYINAGELSSGAPAPGRRVVLVDNSENTENGENTATSIEDLLNNATSINWNEPVYNVLGQRVGEGTTGVLIQNGQKFFVQ